MRHYTDNLTGRKEYIMSGAELRKYRYQIIKEHKAKRKVEVLRTTRRVLLEIGEGLLFTSMIFGTFALCLYFY